MLNSMTPKFFGEKTIKSALPSKLTHCASLHYAEKYMGVRHGSFCYVEARVFKGTHPTFSPHEGAKPSD